MTILNMTSIPKTVSGQAQLLEITSTMADLDKPFNATDVEAVDKFVQCAKVATGFFSVRKSFHRTFFTINQIRLWSNIYPVSPILGTGQEYPLLRVPLPQGAAPASQHPRFGHAVADSQDSGRGRHVHQRHLGTRCRHQKRFSKVAGTCFGVLMHPTVRSSNSSF